MGEVFIVVSEQSEYKKLKELLPCHVYLAHNNPLGNKWQIVVNHAQAYNPSVLITCGSDDFLSTDYVENAMKLLDKGYDFVGANYWYMTDGKHHYKAKYKHRHDFPAGSGRVFTKKCLDAINWEVFDRKKDRLLDDKALEQIKKAKIKTYIIQEAEKDGLRILAVKGKWDCLNPMQKFLTSTTVTMERIIRLPEQFPTCVV
jgi:hypothetical protein